MKPQITTQERKITPDEAGEMLTIHYERIAQGKFKQRSISQKIINRYAVDMLAGNWLLSPQPITFDEDGNIIDGQHRLEAVRKAGVPIVFMVSTGWPAHSNGIVPVSTIDVVDRGRPRSVGQQLGLHGAKNANALAASVNTIIHVATQQRNSVTYASTCHVLRKFGLDQHIDAITSQGGTKNFVGRVVGPLAFYHTTRPKKAEEFAHRLFSLVMDKDTGPQVFAKHMQQHAHDKQHTTVQSLASCIRAWDNNEAISYIRPSIESTRWLASTNTKLADQIRKLVQVG